MHPFIFENNTGSDTFSDETLPVAPPLVTDGTVVTNDADLLTPEGGLGTDLAFLRALRFDECTYGAASCPIHPFICRADVNSRAFDAEFILDSLGARSFRSDHITSLASSSIPYPGYQPGGLNDEIHNDFVGQHMFSKRHEDAGLDPDAVGPISPEEGTHGQLLQFVRLSQLWYIVLHSWFACGSIPKQQWVVLFAVGASPHNEALIGCVSHQLCHNLCD